jgi:FAD/FMN-containing dehydrogenase
MSTTATFTRPVSHLGPGLDSTMVLPGDERFDNARRAWNLAIDQRPAAVIFPESATAVAAAVGYAAERGLRVAAQGTGHNAGPLDSLTDTVLLRTDRMRGIQIDPVARTAGPGRASSGLTWSTPLLSMGSPHWPAPPQMSA